MRLIDADALYKDICDSIDQMTNIGVLVDGEYLWGKLNDALDNAPTIEPKRGKWEEKETFHNADDNPIIEEWQSARCSVCHKYHTTPYMYYFNDYNFCPNCGCAMTKESE